VRPSENSGYVGVPFAWLLDGRRRDFPLFLATPDGRHVLFCDSGELLTADHLDRLQGHDHALLFVDHAHTAHLDEYLSGDLTQVLHDPYIPVSRKAGVVHQCVRQSVTRLFQEPRAERIAAYKTLVRELAEAIVTQPGLDRALVQLTRHDRYTYDHSINVGIFGTVLAKQRYGGDSDLLKALATGFFLHDLGKARVPYDVLSKPGKLSAEEWAVMRQHPMLGFNLLVEEDQVEEETAIIILQHHERPDGTGYPHGLPEEAIHDYAKMAAIADVFDALTSNRPYRGAMSTFKALTIIREQMASDLPMSFFSQFVMLFAEPAPGRAARVPTEAAKLLASMR